MSTGRGQFYDKFPNAQLYFSKRCVEVGWFPDMLPIAEKRGFREMWNHLTHTMFVRIEVQPREITVHYVFASKRNRIMDAEKCKEYLGRVNSILNFHHRKREILIELYKNTKRRKQQKRTVGGDAGNNPLRVKRRRQNAQSLRGLGSADASDDLLRYLPLEVLTETLSYLTVERKAMCRRVCRDWDALVVHSRSALVQVDPLSQYLRPTVAWMLYGTARTWSTSIRTLIFAATHPHRCFFAGDDLIPIVKEMLTALRIKVHIMLLSHITEADYYEFLPPFQSETPPPWSPICRKLLLAHVILIKPRDSRYTKETVSAVFQRCGNMDGFWLKPKDERSPDKLRINRSTICLTGT
ncbi:uncharacterized protein LOC129595428 [Paramacrobiotus metropolitanus]|uniref:uncharacterized protein LOC129595428 n=1 Tax=Paramacrobiotus metropolitanus TaxID=2943436 RepID=UPI002445BC8B|nr:uncharacterized protein LOC129595428 [Paramacrobiotus metropolitanus]